MSDIGRNTIVYVKEETTIGTPEYPAGSNAILLIGDGSFKQPRSFLEDEQRRLTLSELDRIAGVFPAGEWSFSAYIMPSGSLGVAPRIGPLLKGAIGKETVTGGVKVEYSPSAIDDAIPTFTMVYKQGHIVKFCFGCVVDKATIPVKVGTEQDAIGRGNFSGKFLRQRIIGKTSVNGLHSLGATNIKVNDINEIDIEGLVKFGANDNSGAGYEVTAVGVSAADEITISPALDADVPDTTTVEGFVPTPTEAGVTVHGRYGIAQEKLGGGSYADIVISDSQVEIANNYKIIEDEKTDDNYPVTIRKPNKRQITYSPNKILQDGDAKYFKHADLQTLFGVKLPVGNTAASRFRIEMPYVSWETPEVSGSEELRMSRKGMAKASASFDDEILVVFD